MGKRLRVLILEDSQDDTALLLRELRRSGYEVEFERAETAKAMRRLLTDKNWDLILSDYSLPGFNALQALEVLKAHGSDIPFIIISGTVGEETAIAVLKAGARDFLIKGNWTRLGPIIEKELGEAQRRRELVLNMTEQKQTEAQIHAYAARLKVLADASKTFAAVQDYQAILETVAHQTAEALDSFCGVRLISEDGKWVEMVAMHDVDMEMLEFSRTLSSQPLPADDPNVVQRVLQSEQAILVPGMDEAQLRALLKPEHWPHGKRIASQSRLLAPIRTQGQAIGFLLLARKPGAPAFNEQDIRLAQDLADRAALAISNARLFKQVQNELTERKRAEGQTAQLKRLYATLSQINQAIVRIKNREELFAAICDVAVQFGSFTLAWIGILDQSTGDVQPRVVKGMDVDPWPFPLANIHSGPLVNGLVATAIRTASVVTSTDIQTDTRTQRLQTQSRMEGFHSAAAIPFGLRGRIIGTLCLLSHETDFFSAQEEVSLLNEIGLDISFALETLEAETERKYAEAMLRESEQKFSLLFEKSSFAISLSKLPDGILVNINEAFENIFGYSKQEVIGKTSLELGINPDAAGRARVLAALNEHGSARNEELVLHTKSGDTRIFSVNVDFVEIWGEKYILNTSLDITERKHGEGKIAYQSYLLENISDAVLATDVQFRLTSWNHAAEVMYGYRADEVLGRQAQEIIRSEFNDAQRAEAIKSLRENGLYHADVLQYHRDGHSFWVDGGTFALKEPNGQIYGFVSINHDITERKRAEELFRLVVESAPNAILLVNREGVIEMVNPQVEHFFGYDRTELVGLNVDRLVPERWRGRHQSLRQGYLEDPQARAMGVGRDLHGVRKDGSEFPVEIGLTPITTQAGVLVIATVVDITQRKQAEDSLARYTEDLRRSNTELEQFAYVSSHDLQEPLRMVSSYVQLLAKRYKGRLDPDADDFIGFAVEGATRMQQLINDLLAYSRVGTQAKPFAQTDLEAVLENALANLQIAIEETEALIMHDPLPVLMADQVQMVQLFQNLIGNAIKFRDQIPPRVHIHAERDERGWLFSVKDNGIGIDPQFSERIFIIFQRLHTRAEYGGTGIGLAICKKILERHGGRIWFEPAPLQGSIFHFTIPDQGGQHDNKIEAH